MATAVKQQARKAALESAARTAFGPLAGLFADWAYTVPNAETLLRSVLVHGIRAREEQSTGKPASVSRIARATGLHRRIVKEVLATPLGARSKTEEQKHHASRVLEAWHQDPTYQTEDGGPRVLAERGRSSFWTLCRRYAPGHYPSGIRNDLVKVGAIRIVSGNQLKAVRAEYGLGRVPTERLGELGDRVRDLLITLIWNLSANPDELLPCETALTLDLDPAFLAIARQTLGKRIKTNMAAIRADLNSERTRRKGADVPGVRAGVTAFWFEPPHHASRGGADDTPKKARRKAK